MADMQGIDDPAMGKLRYLRPFIVLLPAFIVCVFNIYAGISFNASMVRLLVTVLFFYIVGTIAQSIVRKMMIDASIELAEKEERERKERMMAEEDEDEDEGEDAEETEGEA